MARRNSVWCSMMVISYRRTNVFFTVCILTTIIHLCFYSHTESATVKRNVGRGPSRQLPCSRAWAEHKWHSVAPFCPWLCYTLARPQSLGTSSAKGEPEALPKTRFLPLLPQSMEPQATLKRKSMKTQWAGSVQFGSVAQSCPTLLQPHEPQHTRPPCPSPTPRVHPNKPMSIESVMPPNHPILRRPLLLLPSIFPSIRVFSFSLKREETLTPGPTAWLTVGDVTLSEISQSQKDKYHVHSLAWGTQSSQSHSKRKELGQETMGNCSLMNTGSSFTGKESSGDWLHDNVNAPNATELSI